MQEPQ